MLKSGFKYERFTSPESFVPTQVVADCHPLIIKKQIDFTIL